jgi:hypothetical protein
MWQLMDACGTISCDGVDGIITFQVFVNPTLSLSRDREYAWAEIRSDAVVLLVVFTLSVVMDMTDDC